MQPIGPALAELLNPAINRGDAGMGSGTGLQPPPDNSWDRRAGGEAAAHRARASTRRISGEDVAKPIAAAANPQPPASTAVLEAPQANYGTSATIPTLDPELARQLGLRPRKMTPRRWRGRRAARWKRSASRRLPTHWRI